MNILYIAPASNPHSIRWIIQVNKIIKFTKIVWVTYEKPPKNNISSNLDINYVKLNYLFDLKLITLIKKEFTIIHVQSLARYLIPSLFVKSKNLYLTAWGSDINFTRRKNIIIRLIQNIQLNRCSAITSDSNEMINKLALITKKEKIHRINFGTDCNHFSPYKKWPLLAKNTRYILSTRNFYEIYDIKTLLNAYRLLSNDEKNNFKLILIGKGPCENKLKEFVMINNLNEFVLFPGYVNQSELTNLYSNCEIYISTAKSDAGISASTAEAMASGALCLITNVRENSKWINWSEKSGDLFESSNYIELNKKISKILNLNKEEKEIIKRNARNIILNNNNIEIEMKKFANLIQKNTECKIP